MAVMKRCAPEICEYCGEQLRARVVARCFRCGGPNERRLTFKDIWEMLTPWQRYSAMSASGYDKLESITYMGVPVDAEE